MFGKRKKHRSRYVVPENKHGGEEAEPVKSFEDTAATLVNDEVVEKKSLRERVWAFVDDPGSSFGAQMFSAAVILTIALSCVSFCLETVPELEVRYGLVWARIEQICVGFFTVEYVIRLIACPDKVEFFKGWLNAVDLISIIPFYIALLQPQPVNASVEEGTASASFLRTIRLVRVLRVFKISRYLSWVRIFAIAMNESAQPLAMLLFVMLIGCVLFSTVMFYAEKGTLCEANDRYVRVPATYTNYTNFDQDCVIMEESPYVSIPASFWWCIVTMTTVGYGDEYPFTSVGRFIAIATSLTGILVLAIPITIISTNFNVEYEKLKRKKEVTRARMILFKNHFREKKRGLDAIQGEVEEVVKRACKTMVHDFTELVEVSSREMVVELQELVEIAYKERQRDLKLSTVVKS